VAVIPTSNFVKTFNQQKTNIKIITIMKKTKLLFITLLLCPFLSIKSQELELSKTQMLEDFNETVSYINTFAVHKDLNAIRLGIDYNKEYTALRNTINEQTSICEFKDILERAIQLVQDMHCSFMSYDYFEAYGKYQKKFNFKNSQSYERIKYFEEYCAAKTINLKLPLLYKNGDYVVYADFKYKNQSIKRGTKLMLYNNKKIKSFITDNYAKVWPILWDEQNNTPYNRSFYGAGKDQFSLTFNEEQSRTIHFNLKDSVTLDQKPQRQVFYYSQSKEQAFYFKDQNTLYIGMPFMDVEQGKNIIKKVDSIHSKYGDFEKIIIDIRGNPGGNDMCWRNVLSHLIPQDVSFDIDLKYKYKKPVIDYYNKGKKKTKQETIALLNDSEYWTQSNEIFTLKPHKKTIKHSGNIFVLQDKYIYSSAGNFSNFCLNSDKLISVGTTTNLVGGLQTEPLFFKMKHSELIFRIEPMLDFSGVKSINDFSHNNVEINIPTTVDDYYLRTTFEGDLYSKVFLMKHDKLVTHILANE